MILTNKNNLPQPIVEAVRFDPYTRGDADISVTQLIDSPLVRKLWEEHYDEVEVDVADQLWALRGQALHHILERAAKGLTDVKVEERLFGTYNDRVVSGKYDLYYKDDDGYYHLQDYKDTSVWAVVHGKAEWGYQLNVLADLALLNQMPVDYLEIVAFLKDWNKHSAARDPNYPQEKVVLITFPLWAKHERLDFIYHQLERHFVEPNPLCTSDERWARPDKWAVMKKGRKSALRVFDSEQEAKDYLAKAGDYIEHRAGVHVRCEDYCNVKKWCPFYT